MALGTAQIIFYLLGSAAAIDAMATKPPESKMTTTGTASGGGGGSAQSVFSSGQPQPKAAGLPAAVTPQQDPNMSAATYALTQQMPNSANMIGQNIVDSSLAQPLPGQLSVPNSPLMPGGPNTPPAIPGQGIGGILGNINNVAGAMAAMAPLLGMGPQPERGIHTSGAAGGQPGQSLFALPQRNTLSQILASLPRMYNG